MPHTIRQVQMDNKVVVVTGAAGGIGRALARRFHHAGARGVVIADLQVAGAVAVADELNLVRSGSALGVGVDVSTADGNADLIAAARQAFGEIDLFFANAGIGGGIDLETPWDQWSEAFAVNVNAHIHAAQLLVPGWLERGSGYFCSTASAAGLLSQIGSGPYSVTKHAAVGFAEWLSITYHDRGLRVSCLCPMGVNTNMLSGGEPGSVERIGGDVVRAAGDVLEPETVADIVLGAIEAEQFLILPHPEVAAFEQRKAADRERWLGGMRRLQSKVLGA
jgi:NAD(P)-dependent dehydrogenase (short-subunit alcohol dehydrogenase family)